MEPTRWKRVRGPFGNVIAIEMALPLAETLGNVPTNDRGQIRSHVRGHTFDILTGSDAFDFGQQLGQDVLAVESGNQIQKKYAILERFVPIGWWRDPKK